MKSAIFAKKELNFKVTQRVEDVTLNLIFLKINTNNFLLLKEFLKK